MSAAPREGIPRADPAITGGWRFRILGPVRVDRDGVAVPLESQRAKALLAALVLDAGHPVSVERLIDTMWGEQPPTRALATLQVHVSNLRRVFGDHGTLIVTDRPGYRLQIAADQSDLLCFDAILRSARDAENSGPESAERLLGQALALWSGTALADLPPTPLVLESRTWLESRRLGAVEEQQELLLRLGRHRDAVPELERLVQRYPLRETLWELLMRAHAASGDLSEALAAYRRARRTLVEQLGIEPGERLRRLEAAILSGAPLPGTRPPEADARAAAAEPPETQRVPGPRSGLLQCADGTTVQVDDRVTIGRHPDCTITLRDPAVSRQHAEVRPVAGGCLLVDLSSANGTRVGGTYVAQCLLSDRDVIEIGSTKLVYRALPPP